MIPFPKMLLIILSGLVFIVMSLTVFFPFHENCTGFLRLKTYPCELAIDNGRHLYANLLSVWSIHSLLLDALATVIRVAL